MVWMWFDNKTNALLDVIKSELALKHELVWPIIQNNFLLLTQNLVLSLSDFIIVLFLNLVYSLVILGKCLLFLFPYVVHVGAQIVEFHRTQLSWREIVVEGIIVCVIVLYVVFQKRITKFLRDTQEYIALKSKMAARVAPYILFISSISSLCIMLDTLLLPLVTKSVLPLFTLLLPALTTMRILYFTSNETVKLQSYNRLLRTWIILGIYHATATIGVLFPLSYVLTSQMLFARKMMLVVSIWIQFSSSITDIVFDLIQPIKKLAAGIPMLEVQLSKTTGFLVTMQKFGLLKAQHSAFLVSILQDGMAFLFTAGFMFTPFPVVGVVIVAFLFPCFKSARTIERDLDEDKPTKNNATLSSKTTSSLLSLEHTTTTTATTAAVATTTASASKSKALTTATGTATPLSKRKTTSVFASPLSWMKEESKEEKAEKEFLLLQEELNSIRKERHHWIEYWFCFSFLFLFHLFVLPLPSWLLMLLSLWFQHSYLKGAEKMMLFVYSVSCNMNKRQEQLKAELAARKSSKTSQQQQQQQQDESEESKQIYDDEVDMQMNEEDENSKKRRQSRRNNNNNSYNRNKESSFVDINDTPAKTTTTATEQEGEEEEQQQQESDKES